MSDVSRVEEVFLAVVEKSDPVQRATYLDAACGDDEDFRRRVETLLAAQPQVGQFLESPVDLEPTGVHLDSKSKLESTAAIGDRVGPYKLLERIGEGGMGEVWVADQQESIKRRVALKLIKPGMDSRSVLGRFEAERQALAVMDHPNIAKVLDAGTTKDGRPYFVMELVKGTPITEFADARKLTPKQRLELFVPVCKAIQHAHMKGIIHRDIKPSNVLVALHDEIPVPKVIDFGVAKAVRQQLAEKTIYTGFGALVGTPAYMAPEQATFNQLDIDTRADVYALGVLLYELLAGSPPIESERLKKAALDEVLRIVRDEDPPRPSQRLSTSQTKASIAATRGSEPMKLSQLMRGELDWIVMKALEKDRTRRYESANGFAADIQRYLVGEQVQAVPPSLGYRLRKAYWRNKAAVWVASAFFGLIAGAAVMGAVLAIQARRAEKLADENLTQAIYNLGLADEARDEAIKNEKGWVETTGAYKSLAVEAEVRANSARIDADLLEYESDARVGLLRLARPLRDPVGSIPLPGPANSTTTQHFPNEPELVKLREFQAAAVIAAGQELVPLVPPLDPTISSKPSRDERLFLAGDERTGIELLAIPSLKRIGILREGSERLVNWGFSPDSKTCWTQDTDSVVRFWNSDGSFRAKTPLRTERFVYPAGMTIEEVRQASKANYVNVKDGVALVQSKAPDEGRSDTSRYYWDDDSDQLLGPTDLYSTRTGQFLRRVELPVRLVKEPHWRRSHCERWIMFIDRREMPGGGWEDEAYIVVSADDGRELARLKHPKSEKSPNYSISPSGKWIITYQSGVIGDETRTVDVQLWNTTTWKPVNDAGLNAAIAPQLRQRTFDPSFVTDEIVTLGKSDGWDSSEGVLRLGHPGPLVPWEKLGQDNLYRNPLVGELGGTLIRCGWVLTDANTFQRLKPPLGRKYATELAKLAPDGRFFENLDTITEKRLPIECFQLITTVDEAAYINGTNLFRTAYEPELRFRPDCKRLTIPPEMLELWAQVVVGGDLTPEGRFQAWDEPTWQARQKQLAAMTPPYADFPFPGWVTQEPHLWWWVQTRQLNGAGKEWDRLMAEWRRRSGRTVPDLGPDKWRTPGPAETSTTEADPDGPSNTSNTNSTTTQTSP